MAANITQKSVQILFKEKNLSPLIFCAKKKGSVAVRPKYDAHASVQTPHATHRVVNGSYTVHDAHASVQTRY